MDADTLLTEAIAEAVRETLDDPRIDPEKEIERLQNLVATTFRSYYQECLQETQEESRVS